MNYELAKRLKDAGFIFKNREGYITRHCESCDEKESFEDKKCSGFTDTGGR
jgi:hypothetical protein